MIARVSIAGSSKLYDLFDASEAEDFIYDLIMSFTPDSRGSAPDRLSVFMEELDISDSYYEESSYSPY